jgi:cell division protein FtsL
MPPRRWVIAVSMVRRGKARLQANRQTSLAVLLSTVMALGGMLLYLWPQMHLVDLEYRYSELQTLRTKALHRQKELQVELATLSQLSRIEDIAIRRLGLRHPAVSQVVYVYPGQPIADSGRER